MLSFLPQDAKKILDVGCGAGEFGLLLKSRKDVEVWGIEKSDKAASSAKTKLNKVITADIEKDISALPPSYFDCIVFNDVLEHLIDPWGVLKNMADHLQENGYIVASIPNMRYFYTFKDLMVKKEWTYVEEGVLDNTHLRFFTIKSIKDLFFKCGYRVLSIVGINGIDWSWKFNLLNHMLLGQINDMRYKQFACIAQKIGK
ncbi:MAG: class I SAM-dependent methyltransferase [Candidatus Omnitrophota bacterium]